MIGLVEQKLLLTHNTLTLTHNTLTEVLVLNFDITKIAHSLWTDAFMEQNEQFHGKATIHFTNNSVYLS